MAPTALLLRATARIVAATSTLATALLDYLISTNADELVTLVEKDSDANLLGTMLAATNVDYNLIFTSTEINSKLLVDADLSCTLTTEREVASIDTESEAVVLDSSLQTSDADARLGNLCEEDTLARDGEVASVECLNHPSCIRLKQFTLTVVIAERQLRNDVVEDGARLMTAMTVRNTSILPAKRRPVNGDVNGELANRSDHSEILNTKRVSLEQELETIERIVVALVLLPETGESLETLLEAVFVIPRLGEKDAVSLQNNSSYFINSKFQVSQLGTLAIDLRNTLLTVSESINMTGRAAVITARRGRRR